MPPRLKIGCHVFLVLSLTLTVSEKALILNKHIPNDRTFQRVPAIFTLEP